MSTLLGRPFGPASRPVLARAALLSDENGPASLAPDLLVQAARRARYTADGPLEVILVARRLSEALAVGFPGLSVVGIVAEEDESRAGDDGPLVIVGVAGARDTIAEGDLLIVDRARGRVHVQPDADAIARVQAEPERARVLLGAAYTPARTLGGRLVPVWATLADPDDLPVALEAGADGLLLSHPVLEDLRGSNSRSAADEESPFVVPLPPSPALLATVDAVGGGDITLETDGLNTLDPVHLVHLGARCNLRWLFDPAEVPPAARDLRAEICALADEEEDRGRPARAPLLVARLNANAPTATGTESANDALFSDGFDEVVLFVENVRDAEAGFRDAMTAARVAATQRDDTPLPLRVWLAAPDAEAGDANAWLDVLARLVAQGAAGVIVPPRCVAAAKDRIRTAE